MWRKRRKRGKERKRRRGGKTSRTFTSGELMGLGVRMAGVGFGV